MNKVKLTANILFSGIGAQERGFRDSNLFEIDIVNTSDIDKEAVVSYAAMHCGLTPGLIETYDAYPSRNEMAQHLTDINLGYVPEKNKVYDWFKVAKKKSKDIEKYWLACKLSKNLGDISKIKRLEYADLWTISFPCQSISVSGKMKGFAPDSGTRSSLLWENIRLLKDSVDRGEAPEYIMFENVKNLVGKKFKADFDVLVGILEDLGYVVYWDILNGKTCGIPQNRERVFVICIRNNIDNGAFTFPKPFDNGLRLKDVLEDEVEEKYYMNNDKAQKLIEQLIANGTLGDVGVERERVKCVDCTLNEPRERDIANCISARTDRGISNHKQEGTCVVEPARN